ncbi:uncharacterized protein LOC134853722 [Symsagittifera roscoffensis]|uniref:uncharacterized protein LOC134853722 n=1 Tax=Symsagittifera roscoffensis TaxID=84072 RepID=UPI00307CBC1D
MTTRLFTAILFLAQHTSTQIIVQGPDKCSYDIKLQDSFTIRNERFHSIHMCSNGYITFGSDAPEVLMEPDQFDKLNASTILSPALIRQPETLSPVHSVNVTYEELTFETVQNLSKTWIGDPKYVKDDYFRPRWGFSVFWKGPQNEFGIYILQDRKLRTIQGPLEKTLIIYDYRRLDLTVDTATGQEMRSGINSPNNTIKWTPVGSSSDLGGYLSSWGRYEEGLYGMWMYQLNPRVYGPVLEGYFESDCNKRNCTLTAEQKQWIKYNKRKYPNLETVDFGFNNGNLTYTNAKISQEIYLHQLRCCDLKETEMQYY